MDSKTSSLFLPSFKNEISSFVVFFLSILSLGISLRMIRQFSSRKSRQLPYPPGPKGLPIVGNALQLPLKAPWFKFTEWAAVYGDVYYLQLLNRHVIVLNSFKAGFDLLHKRGAIPSDRPGMALVRDHGGMSWNLPTEPYGAEMHLKRRFLNQSLNTSAVKNQLRFMQDNARDFVRSLLQKPKNFQSFNRRYTGANMMMLAYGHQVVDENDEWVRNAEELAETVDTVGVHPIDLWPILGRLPFRIWGKQFGERMEKMRMLAHLATTVPYSIVKQKFFDGSIVPSMAMSLLEENLSPDNKIDHEESINGVLAITYIAGEDTSVASLDTFVIAMIHHPEIQHKAQATIDELLQGERLPTFDDRMLLPYVDAIMREVLRWKPVVPGGVPHSSIQDDEYQGMFIPKGTMIVFNVLAMMHDSREFPDPENFHPRRFLGYENRRCYLREDLQNPEDIAFGFGRRICPGRHLAKSWLWLTIATLLAVFEISPELDEEGKPILPDLEYESSIVSHPKPFRCNFRPRPEMASFVKSADFL